MTASGLAASLVRRISVVGDPVARVGLAREILGSLTTDEVRDVARAIVELAGLRDSAAQVTLLALAEARTQGQLGARPSVPPGVRTLAGADTGAADWGTGRPLTLGERKSLARRPERRLLERALRDAHPDVVAEVLRNPRLTEADLARACAASDARPEVLARVFVHPRWAVRPRVRRALASNPRTPVEIAEALVPLLARAELREVAGDERLARAVRRRALEVLRRLPPTPDSPVEPQ